MVAPSLLSASVLMTKEHSFPSLLFPFFDLFFPLPPSSPPQVRDQINSEHRMKGLVDRSLDCAEKLVALYEDRDG